MYQELIQVQIIFALVLQNTGASFIIDGRKLKSINQYYNKINAKLQSIKDKQKIERTTLRQKRITRKRNNRINDYLSKAARIIVNYCLIMIQEKFSSRI